MRAPRHPTAVGRVLTDVLQRFDREQQLPGYRIWTFWNEEVGEAIARRAQPTRLRDGVLFVTVATHSWMQELRFMKDTIRERLNTRLGTPLVHDIFFIAGSLEPVPVPDAPAARVVPSGRALVSLPVIADPTLAGAFSRIVEARAQRLAQDRAARRQRTRVKKR